MATMAELIAEAEENIDYDVVNSVAKCRLLVVALRKLKLRRPRFVTVGGNQTTFDDLMQMLSTAEAWLAANGGAAGADGGTGGSQSQYYDMRNIRR